MNLEKDINFWNSRAEGYDEHQYNKNYKKLIQRIVKDTGSVSSVLDVATGTGIIAFEIAKNVQNIEASDFSEVMIEIANEKKKKLKIDNINFIVQDVYKLNYPDNTFDIIILCNSLHVMEYPEKALKSIRRMLKPKGQLIAPTACFGETEEALKQAKEFIETGFPAYNLFSVNEYLQLVQNCGYKIIRNESVEYRMPMQYVVAEKEIKQANTNGELKTNNRQ